VSFSLAVQGCRPRRRPTQRGALASLTHDGEAGGSRTVLDDEPA
jgi:hypothetical protein